MSAGTCGLALPRKMCTDKANALSAPLGLYISSNFSPEAAAAQQPALEEVQAQRDRMCAVANSAASNSAADRAQLMSYYGALSALHARLPVLKVRCRCWWCWWCW